MMDVDVHFKIHVFDLAADSTSTRVAVEMKCPTTPNCWCSMSKKVLHRR